MKIEDGTGKGYEVKVNSENRMQTSAITEASSLHASENENAYNINSGQVSFTGDGTLIYLQNNENKDLVVEAMAVGTDGGGTYTSSLRPFITILRNPTAGDLISDATAVSHNVNRNFGSSASLTAAAYKGKQGGTITGGSEFGILQTSSIGRDFFTINIIIPKGSSIAIKTTNGLASGTAKIYCALIVYLKDSEAS